MYVIYLPTPVLCMDGIVPSRCFRPNLRELCQEWRKSDQSKGLLVVGAEVAAMQSITNQYWAIGGFGNEDFWPSASHDD